MPGPPAAAFQQHDTDDDYGIGLAVEDIASALNVQGVEMPDALDAIDFLANEGHLYSTIDHKHYKSATPRGTHSKSSFQGLGSAVVSRVS